MRKLSRIDHTLVNTKYWRNYGIIGTFSVHWFRTKYHVYTFNSIISHPILMRLITIDQTLVEMNLWRHVDAITFYLFHWRQTKIICFSLTVFLLSDLQGKNEESVQLDFNLKRFNFEMIFKSIFKFIGTIFGPIFFFMEMIFRSIFNFIGTMFGTIFRSIFTFITI